MHRNDKRNTDTENFFHKKLKLQFSENKQGYLILFLPETRTGHTSTFGNTQHDSFLNINGFSNCQFLKQLQDWFFL